jgi:hypothetical protein
VPRGASTGWWVEAVAVGEGADEDLAGQLVHRLLTVAAGQIRPDAAVVAVEDGLEPLGLRQRRRHDVRVVGVHTLYYAAHGTGSRRRGHTTTSPAR